MFQTNVKGIAGKRREEHKTPVESFAEKQRGGMSLAVNEDPCSKRRSSRAQKYDQAIAV